MSTDHEYLQCLGLGLQGLRASGQFCDAMVCVGSTRILVHKVVLSAASKTLHDLALEFDMTPHRERDQLEIIVPPDISLYAVNIFINYLYTGQVELRDSLVDGLKRLAHLFGLSSLLRLCQNFIQQSSAPDSQSLNVREEGSQIEPDSSSTTGLYQGRLEDPLVSDGASLTPSLTRSNSVCSGHSAEVSTGLASMSVKLEPQLLAMSYGQGGSHRVGGQEPGTSLPSTSPGQPAKGARKMTMLEKLMSPVVNLTKLPANITPNTVVMVSDDEQEEDCTGSLLQRTASQQFSLEEKEAIALEAKRLGTTQVSQMRNIPLRDVLKWMALFGLRSPVTLKAPKQVKQVSQNADQAIVRWIAQQQDLNGCVDLNSLKKYAITVHRQKQPNFHATSTWLGNFLKRNLTVLQGTKFVCYDENDNQNGDSISTGVTVKKELMSVEVLAGMNHAKQLHQFAENEPTDRDTLHSDGSASNQSAVDFGLGAAGNDDSDNEDAGFTEDQDEAADYITAFPLHTASTGHERAVGTVQTPFGKRPIIVGQAKCFDAKSERRIVQWVLERNMRDGYVFTDDFKDYARSLYTGSKPFGATQAWMKKFLRRNRALRHVKFCSKFKNTYTHDEKMAAVAMARKFGPGYAAKQTGISHKMIHCWRLAVDRGQLTPSPSVANMLQSAALPSPSGMDVTLTGLSALPQTNQALHGIVPEFESQIIQKMKDIQAQEGSINYDEISKISQEIYKETRPTFKASYSWIKSFLDRHKEETKDIDIDNVNKVIMENEDLSSISSENIPSQFRNNTITELVDNALKAIEAQEAGIDEKTGGLGTQNFSSTLGKTAEKRPIVVGPSVSFDRKTEKLLVDWALERQGRDGYIFTDDFKDYARSLHKGSKRFSASSGWMSLFLRRHRNLRHVNWRSKFKNNYSEAEKMAAIAEAKRLGTGHVGRKLGIDPALICAWRIKMEKNAQKPTFWKGTKIRKFGKGIKSKFPPIKLSSFGSNDAARGIVPEFEKRIVELIQAEHEREGSISYEEISSISQSIYKETRPTFKASYAWIRNFLKRHEGELAYLTIDNVKKVFIPEDNEDETSNSAVKDDSSRSKTDTDSFNLPNLFQKRPIIVGQSRSLDTKTEKKLVQWLVEQQAKNGYVFLDQFKAYAQSLYKGNKVFAATQAWRIKFMRRNHAAVKHVKFTSSFRNQYSLEEKKAIVMEAKRFGVAFVAKKTGIDHCLINAWKVKLERSGDVPADSPAATPSHTSLNPTIASLLSPENRQKQKPASSPAAPGVITHRGALPQYERKIVALINQRMDFEGSVSYQNVSNIARAVYKEIRPNFKACYNWIKDFIKRNRKALKHVDFEHTRKILLDTSDDTEILIAEDKMDDFDMYMQDFDDTSQDSMVTTGEADGTEVHQDPEIVIENAEEPFYEKSAGNVITPKASGSIDIVNIVAKKPVIVGMPVHFDRKTERKLVEWLVQKQESDGFVFTDDFREYARTWYTGPPQKFAATNAWISKFLRRNRLNKRINFQSRLKGNNPKFEERIVQLILEQQNQEGSVSYDDIQKITQSVYKETRPNFRACYNWIKDFIKRHKEELASVDLENVKKVFIPDDDNGNDGVLIRDYDPSKGIFFSDTGSDYSALNDMDAFAEENSMDRLETDSLSASASSQSALSSSVLRNLLSPKRPIIVAPPKSLDIKTEKKLVEWMLQQQRQQGCVYLDLFKDYAKSIHTGPKKFAATQAWMIKFKQRNHAALKNIVIKSRFRNEYSIEEKMAAVEEARRLGCHHVGRKLGINGSVIYSWKVQLENAERMEAAQGLGMADPDTDRECTRGMVPEFEERIVELVLEKQAEKNSVSYDDVSMIGRSVYCETRPNFKASYNWVVEFIRKNKDRFEGVVFENQRRAMSVDEKLQILSEEKKYGTDHVTKKRNISASTIYNWKKSMQAKSIPIPKYKALVGNKIKQKYTKGKKMHIYTEEEKRRIVSVAEENGITYASMKHGISRNVLSKWISLFRLKGENIVIKSAPVAVVRKELEQKIVAWVLEQNEELGVVMTNRIQEYAKKVFEEGYTRFNATDYWLEVFISQNKDKFKHVRFREKNDSDLDFTTEIKLKLSRYAERHGAVETANKTGLSPKNIYHWRRCMKQKGFDLTAESMEQVVESNDESSQSPEPSSMMQQKLDRIGQKYSPEQRKVLIAEAQRDGTSMVASKYKIPLPLLLKWMKSGLDISDGMKPDSTVARSSFSVSSKESTPESTNHKLVVRLPSVERNKSGLANRYSAQVKRELCEEAKVIGVMETSRKHNIPNSTLYMWMKDLGESGRKSMDRSSVKSNPFKSSNEMVTSTPIREIKIKQEPEPYEEYGSQLSYEDTESVRVVRKYSEGEKLACAEKAMEVGIKQASKELGIPLSNVRRWTDMYSKKLKQKEASQKRKLIRQERRLSSSIPSFHQSDIGDSSMDTDFSGSEHSQSFSDDRKRKGDALSTMSLLKQSKQRYSDAEKLDFVMQSDIHGAKLIAMKAGVSIDVMYKWRQKFPSRPKPRAESPAAELFVPQETAALGDSHQIETLQEEQMKVRHQQLTESGPSHFHHIDEEGNLTNEDDELIDSGIGNLDSAKVILPESSKNDDPKEGSIDSLSEMSSIFQLEKSAASKVLEMTADYIEAEIEHQKYQCDWELEQASSDDVVEALAETMPVNPESVAPMSEGHVENTEESGLFKIIDVKSEAML